MMRCGTRAALSLLAACGVASAQGVVDQSNTGQSVGGQLFGDFGGAFTLNAAQTFTPGVSGQLLRVEVRTTVLGAPTLPVTLDIRPVVSGNGAPETTAANALATVTVPAGQIVNGGFTSFDLSGSNVILTAGQRVAWTLRTNQQASATGAVIGYAIDRTAAGYSGGDFFSQVNGGAFSLSASVDAQFRTFMAEPSRLLGSCPDATTGPVVNSAGIGSVKLFMKEAVRVQQGDISAATNDPTGQPVVATLLSQPGIATQVVEIGFTPPLRDGSWSVRIGPNARVVSTGQPTGRVESSVVEHRCYSDVNGDGTLNVFDIFAYFAAFGAGC